MKSSTIFAQLLTVVSITSAFQLRGLENDTTLPVMNENEAEFYSRVTNGLAAAPNQFPYQAALSMVRDDGNSYLCSGSLISPEWVLTAAHCLADAETIYVLLGARNRFEPEITYHRTRHDAIYPREFVRSTLLHDIGLIKIPEVLYSPSDSPSVSHVFLPRLAPNFPDYVGQSALFAGWGHTSDSARDNSPTLRYSSFTIISNRECANTYGDLIYDGKMCTSSVYQISACHGDSGGGLVFLHSNTQVGISSHGHSSGCEHGYPTTFTRVESYLAWISSVTGIIV